MSRKSRPISTADNKTDRNEPNHSTVPGLYAQDLKTKSIKTSKRSKISTVSSTYLREADKNISAPKIYNVSQSCIRKMSNNMNSLPVEDNNSSIHETTISITIQQFPKPEKNVSLFHTINFRTILVETLLPVKFSTNTVETLAVYENVTDDPT